MIQYFWYHRLVPQQRILFWRGSLTLGFPFWLPGILRICLTEIFDLYWYYTRPEHPFLTVWVLSEVPAISGVSEVSAIAEVSAIFGIRSIWDIRDILSEVSEVPMIFGIRSIWNTRNIRDIRDILISRDARLMKRIHKSWKGDLNLLFWKSFRIWNSLNIQLPGPKL